MVDNQVIGGSLVSLSPQYHGSDNDSTMKLRCCGRKIAKMRQRQFYLVCTHSASVLPVARGLNSECETTAGILDAV